jgi:hypothetical protein
VRSSLKNVGESHLAEYFVHQPATTRNWHCIKMHFLHSLSIRKAPGWAFQNCNRIGYDHPLWFNMDIWRMTFHLENRRNVTQVGIHMPKKSSKINVDLFIAGTILKPEPSSITWQDLRSLPLKPVPEPCLTKTCQNSTGNAGMMFCKALCTYGLKRKIWLHRCSFY